MASMTAPVSQFETVKSVLANAPKRWLVTGVAGFIGSHLLETLLDLNQQVVGLDNFSTGFQHNLDDVKRNVGATKWSRFKFIEGDICNPADCEAAVSDVNYVLHQAALGSVPRSIENPLATNASNVTGFLNMLVAARDAKVDSFTYAASSSTYGDHPALPKVEDTIGKPLSPYAVTKLVNELYAEVFARSYGFNCIGLRYFNVFGPRQNPNGAYAAVIPKWIDALLSNTDVIINGDGETSRDYCFIENTVQANILAATSDASHKNEIYNVALGDTTSLNALFFALKEALALQGVVYSRPAVNRAFRSGDVRHSQADIGKIVKNLGYVPLVRVQEGICLTVNSYFNAARANEIAH